MVRARKKEEEQELNLVPIMNMVTTLIPVLLMSVQFMSLAVIDSTLPAIGKPKEVKVEPDEKPLNLSVAVTNAGYTILGAEGVLGNVKEEGATIPCTADRNRAAANADAAKTVSAACGSGQFYDVKTLREQLGQIKDRYPDEENVILVPASSVQYETLVSTMDATRNDPNNTVDKKPRELFPFVVIAGGAQ